MTEPIDGIVRRPQKPNCTPGGSIEMNGKVEQGETLTAAKSVENRGSGLISEVGCVAVLQIPAAEDMSSNLSGTMPAAVAAGGSNKG